MLVFAVMTVRGPAEKTESFREKERTGPGKADRGPDEDLILRIGQGDREAFEALYTEISGAVYAYAFSILLNRESAEDAMQETFLRIRASAHLYIPKGKPMAWILTITRNLCMMRFRKVKKETTLIEAGKDLSAGLALIKAAEDRIVLEAALKVLSEEELRIIVLHAVSGMKHREISESMQIPLSTVLSRYQRGLSKLRKELKETDL